MILINEPSYYSLYGRKELDPQHRNITISLRITYKVLVYIFDEMDQRNLNNNHSSRNVPKIIFFSLRYWLVLNMCSQIGLTDLLCRKYFHLS